MAEGGVAAALANVDDRDNWRVHFADTMRGGQYLNNWRMAELHAKEAPERVRELEAWGALFDRTKDGRILQRNFGGHRYPRLAHVGDRTGLEMIRTLQDHGIHTGMEVHMECTVLSLLLDGGRIAGAFGYDREKGHFILWPAKAVVLATGGIGRAYKITSNSWEYTGDGHALAYRAGAELLDMEFVQFHPTGMVWPISVRGILVTEGVRGEGGVLRNSEGRRFMFDDIPDLYKEQTADTEEEGWRYTQGDKNARRPPELLTRDHVARCINREVKGGPRHAARRRLSRYRLDQGTHSERRGAHQAQAAQHVPPVQAARRYRHHEGADGSRSHHALHDGRNPRGWRFADVHRARTLRRRRSGRGTAWRQPAGRQFAVRSAGVRQARRTVRRGVRQSTTAPATVDDGAGAGRGRSRARTLRARPVRRESVSDPVRSAGHRCRIWSASCAPRAKCSRRSTRSRNCATRAARAGIAGNRQYNNGWHTAMDLANMLMVSEAITRAALLRKESRGAQFREDFPDKDPEWGKYNIVVAPRRGWRNAGREAALPPMPDELKADDRGDEIDGRQQATIPHLARRSRRRKIPGLHHAGGRGHGGARRRAPHPGPAGARSGGAMELQGRQVRLLLRRDQRHAAS